MVLQLGYQLKYPNSEAVFWFFGPIDGTILGINLRNTLQYLIDSIFRINLCGNWIGACAFI